MTERRKWLILAGLAPVLGITLVLRLGHRPHAAPVEAGPVIAGDGAPHATPDPDVPAGAGSAAASARALDVARALLDRPAAEFVLPRRDLFAPGSGEAWIAAGDGADAGSGIPALAAGADTPAVPTAEVARVAAPPPGPLALTATFQDGGVRMALLGGTLVREGEAVRGGYVLARVEEGRVTLTRGKDVLVVDMPAR